MGSATRKSYRIHLCCSILVVAFLISVPIIAATSSTQGVAGAGTGIKTDPLHRLPASPEEAHQRLQESRKVGWPEAEAGDMSASSVQKGVHVSIPHDTVEGYTTHANSNVRVKLIRGVTTIQTVNTKTNPNKLFTADLSTGNIKSGDKVEVKDLVSGAPVVINCTLTGAMNLSANRVTGVAPYENKIDVYIRAPSTYYGDVPHREQIPPVVAHKATRGGHWMTSFSGALSLRRGDVASIFSTSTNGSSVMNMVNAGGSLVVYPQYNDVMGYYQAGKRLNVKAGTATRTVGTAGDGFFEAWFTNHNIVPGETVSCYMGSNRSITVADITANCDITTNHVKGTGPANKIIRVTMNPYGTPVVVQSNTNAQGKFDVSLAGRYIASGTDVYSVTWYDSDSDCAVYEFQNYSWHLAEGYTGGDFDTYVLVQNPGAVDANVTMTFQLETNTAAPLSMTVPANSRTTVKLDDLPGLDDASVSTKVTCTNGATVNAERSMYFVYYGDNLASGKSGGHDSIGVLTPSKTWYLAEGYTGGDFDTYVLVQNPGATDAKVTLDFQLPVGSSASPYSFDLKANSRYTVHLDNLPGLAATDVSTKVSSNQPVVAERAMYFMYFGNDPANGKDDGSDSIGVTAPGKTWYMAEGYTGGQFDTWVLVQNPTTKDATVTMKFQLEQETAPDHVFTLPAGGRQTVHLNELEGLSAGVSVSTKVTSNVDVVAERAMYFNYYGKTGGHTSNSITAPARGWYLPEGYTGGDFNTYVLVQNPGTTDATVTMDFQLPSPNTAPSQTYTVKAGARLTVRLNALEGLSGTDVSTKVSSNVPVVVERAMYFNYYGKDGGTDSVGIPF